MANNELRQTIENILNDSSRNTDEVIDEIMAILEKKQKTDYDLSPAMSKEDKIFTLQSEINKEEDWQKRARLAARLISERLST